MILGQKTNRNETALVVLLLFVACMACYVATLSAGFVWDDEFIIVNNPLIRAPLWSFQIFKQDVLNSGFTGTAYYRPLQMLSYAVDYRLWGMNPAGFHFTNILLHFANGLLLFFLVRNITRKRFVALFSSFFFVIHPVQVGAVSYISSRTDLLFFFFGLLTMLCHNSFMKSNKRALFCVSYIFFGAALLSKEAAIIFAFLLFFTDIVAFKVRFVRAVKHNAGYFVIVAAYVFLHGRFLGGKYSRIFGQIDVLEFSMRYFDMAREFITLIFFPSSMYLRRVAGSLDGGMAAFFGAVGLLVLMVLLLRKNVRMILFSLGFFLIALVPFFLSAGQLKVFAEHWLYLPGCGIIVLSALSALCVYERYCNLNIGKYLFFGTLLICMFFCAGMTMDQNKHWRSGESLSDRVLAFSRQDRAALYYKAVTFRKEGEFERSADAMKQYAEGRPNDSAAWYSKGRMAISTGDISGAERDFKKALLLDSDYFNGYLGLAMVSYLRKEHEQSIEYLERALELDPGNFETLYLLCGAYSMVGDDAKALEVAIKSVKVNPYGCNALLMLAEAYVKMGYIAEGAGCFLKATRLYPEEALPCYGLGRVFLMSGRAKEGEEWLRKAVIVDPSYKPAIELLSKLKSSK